MRKLIRKWLGLDELETVTKSQVEDMLAEHFAELKQFVRPIEHPKLEEKKQPVKRVRNFSQFRDKVEESIFLEN